MKVSYVTMEFPSPSETFASNDVRALKSLGVDIDVHCMKRKNANYERLIEERNLKGINIHSTEYKYYLVGLLYSVFNPILFLKIIFWVVKNDYPNPQHCLKMLLLVPAAFYIYKSLVKQKPDVIHLFWGHYPSLVGFLIQKSKFNAKLSVFLGAYDLRYKLGVSKWVAAKADYVFTHTNANVAVLKSEFGIDNINTIYRGIDTQLLSQISLDKKAVRENIILAAGRLLDFKRFEAVVELFASLKQRSLVDKLIIAGDGPQLSSIHEQCSALECEQYVKLVGHVSQNELFSFMASSKYFVHFSLVEHLPNVIKEAMFLGSICITTETPGIDELVQNNKSGFIFSSDNYMNAKDVFKLTENDFSGIRENARKHVLENFDTTENMKKYLSIWCGLGLSK